MQTAQEDKYRHNEQSSYEEILLQREITIVSNVELKGSPQTPIRGQVVSLVRPVATTTPFLDNSYWDLEIFVDKSMRTAVVCNPTTR